MTQFVTDETGQQHEFPDEATPQQILQALGRAPKTPAESVSPAQALLQAGARPRELTQDFATQILHGLGRGVAAIPGIAGDIPNLVGSGLEWLGSKVAPETTAGIAGAINPIASLLTPPTSAETIGFAERNIIGERPKPKSDVSRFAGNVAQYIPGAAVPLGGATLTNIAKQAGLGALSGAASEGAKEAGWSPAAQVAAGMVPATGAIGLNMVRGGPASRLVREATSELSPEDWQKAAAVQQTAKEVGVPLIGSEALAPKVGPGAIGELASQVKATARGGPIINPIFEQRPEQIREVASKAIARIGPDATANDVLVNTRDVASKAIAQAKLERSQITSPLYQAAGKIDIPAEAISPIIAKIDEAIDVAGKTPLRAALTKLRGQLTTESGVETRTSRLQDVYQHVRDAMDDPSIVEGSLRKQIGTLAPINNQIRDALVANNPTYAQADALFKRMSEPVVALAGTADNPGLMARVRDATSQAELRTLLLDPENVSPDTVRIVADVFRSQNRANDLSAWVRHYLENSLDKASKDLQSGQNPALGANWRNLIGGAPNQRAVLDTYLNEVDPTGGASRGMGRLLQVVERTAKTPGTGSPTAGRLQMAESLGRGAAPTAAGIGAAGALGTLGAPAGGMAAGYMAADFAQRFIRNQAMRMGSGRLARALTDPDAVGKLRTLAHRDPSSPAAAAAVMAILGGRAEEE